MDGEVENFAEDTTPFQQLKLGRLWKYFNKADLVSWVAWLQQKFIRIAAKQDILNNY